ncbi:MAG: tryptophan synthase subunit alpha [Acidobacteria bacterium]|nr:tryptophan synthase subunit alpha [Acidobacteriota bacterium]
MSRIAERFSALRTTGRPGLVTYVTAGDPDAARSAMILQALDRAGADILEVGIPFSDPLADGPVIQRASQRALAAGTTLASTLALVGNVRRVIQAPIVLFTYANPVLRYGVEAFVRRAAEVGADGALVLDLPIEEAGGLRERLASAGLDLIFLLSPTTTTERIRKAASLGSGFLYGISRLGVTGARDRLAVGAQELVARIRAITALPVAVGFGISRPEHVAEVGRWADAAVVGSALVNMIERDADSPDLTKNLEGYVQWLKGASAT